jgi:hypothetical protein
MDSKIPLLIVNKGQELITQLIPPIIQIANQTGIQNIGTPNVQLPSTCLSSEELQKILTLRNNLVGKLNATSNLIDKLSKPLDVLSPTVDVLSTSLKITNTARIATNTAMAALVYPGVPGTFPSIVNNLKDLIDFINPKITKTKNIITSIKSALDYANSILSKLINIFKSIDQYLTQCGASSISSPLTELNPYLQQIEQNQNVVQTNPVNQIYNGFILEVREEPFSPTINRRRAVALNNSGIVMLKTPLSFTTIPEVLIQELKLIIDSNNLKAN